MKWSSNEASMMAAAIAIASIGMTAGARMSNAAMRRQERSPADFFTNRKGKPKKKKK